MTLLLALAWACAVGAIVVWLNINHHPDPDELHRDERIIRNVRWPG